MKNILLILISLAVLNNLYAQNVGIGTTTPTLGKLEVLGTFGFSKTVAAFGSDGAGISLQRNSPTIGFNQYRDALGSKFMSNGFASTITLDEATGIMAWDMYNSGFKGNPTIGTNRAITIIDLQLLWCLNFKSDCFAMTAALINHMTFRNKFIKLIWNVNAV